MGSAQVAVAIVAAMHAATVEVYAVATDAVEEVEVESSAVAAEIDSLATERMEHYMEGTVWRHHHLKQRKNWYW